MSSDNHQFHLGIDYVISREGRIYLLEINMLPGDLSDDRSASPWHEKDHLFDSRVSSFCNAITPKLNQHEVFGNMMPRYEPDKRKMKEFAQSRRVIYKGDMGRQGDSVSMSLDPKKLGGDYFVEEFIEPRGETIAGVDHPYIVREYGLVTATDKNGILHWKSKNVYRKQAREARDHPKSFVLSTDGGSAQGANASVEDIVAAREMTEYVIEIINNTGRAVDWNPSLCFSRVALAEFFPGTIPLLGQRELSGATTVQQVLEERYSLGSFCHHVTLPVSVAVHVAQQGWTGVFVPSDYKVRETNDSNQKWWEHFEVSSEGDRLKLILTRAGRFMNEREVNQVVGEYPKPDNLYILSKGSQRLDDIVNSIAERWRSLRAA